jgi:tight adherence protein B
VVPVISVAALAGPALLVLALAYLRAGPPRATRRPDAALARPAARPPSWVGQTLTLVGLDTDPVGAWAAIRWTAPLAILAIAVVVSPVAALLTAGGLLGAPRGLRRTLQRRMLDRRDAQLPAALERMASSLRAGSALAPAFVELAATAPEPLAAELRSVAAEIQHGAGMAAAVDRWAGQPAASAAVRLTGAALALGVDAGGEIARSLDRVAATLRERRELQAEVHALATQARASAAVLALAPLAFTALVSGIEPGMVRFLVATPLGWLCLGGGLGLEAAGVAWMARIVAGAS